VAALAPPVAAVRVAVRRALAPLRGSYVLVACSGGADSLALAAATAFVAPKLGVQCGLITVDHGLQAGSARRAEQVVWWASGEGFAPAAAVAVEVAGRPGGPEAAARQARYEALVGFAQRTGAAAVLLGHTRDDQAETVLLALARGAGPRGLAGMPDRRVIDGIAFLRPLLAISRAQALAACTALKLEPWQDPHNTDPAYARARVRELLASLVDTLGPGVVDNLARTAGLVAQDTAALDALAAEILAAAGGGGSLAIPMLVDLPDALRTRVLHGFALAVGSPGGALGYRHVAALDALVTNWHGQGPVALPGGIQVYRRGDQLRIG
jgi:tRNA(Ile)-lysidine synthase